MLELSGANALFVHIGGIAILVGRVIHAKGLLSESLPHRKLGMLITIFTIIGLAVFDMGYAAYKLLG